MKLVFLLLLGPISTVSAFAETTELRLAGNGVISFDVPQMKVLKDSRERDRVQYQASSVGLADERFNLTVFIEPVDCHYGHTTKEITRCFLEKSDEIPLLIKDTRSTNCRERFCAVFYSVGTLLDGKEFRQQHTNVIFAYRNGWAHVHFSVVNPTDDDIKLLMRFVTSVRYTE